MRKYTRTIDKQSKNKPINLRLGKIYCNTTINLNVIYKIKGVSSEIGSFNEVIWINYCFEQIHWCNFQHHYLPSSYSPNLLLEIYNFYGKSSCRCHAVYSSFNLTLVNIKPQNHRSSCNFLVVIVRWDL